MHRLKNLSDKFIKNFLIVLCIIAFTPVTTYILFHSCEKIKDTKEHVLTCSNPVDTVLLEDLEHYADMMVWKYPYLKKYNNPYGICEETFIVKFSSVEEARKCAIEALERTPYRESDYDNIKDFFQDVFNTCLPD